ncbi:MAG: hypothetical protein V3T70_09560, partial [Phycisphaerae bacterium]
QCGFNRRTGEHLSVAVEGEGTGLNSQTAGGTVTPPPRRRSDGPSMVGRLAPLIKPVLILAVLGGVVWAGYELLSYDPVGQGEDKLGQLTSGMPLGQAVEILGRPQACYVILDAELQEEKHTSQSVAKIGYADNFFELHGDRLLRNGFYLVYRFSAGGEHKVYFGPDGAYEGFEEVPNLLNR